MHNKYYTQISSLPVYITRSIRTYTPDKVDITLKSLGLRLASIPLPNSTFAVAQLVQNPLCQKIVHQSTIKWGIAGFMLVLSSTYGDDIGR